MKTPFLRSIAAALLLAAWHGPLAAKTIVWDGGLSPYASTNWNEVVNWKDDVKPGADDIAVFSNNGQTGISTAKTILLGAPQEVFMISMPSWASLPSGVTFGNAQDAALGNTLTVQSVYRWSNAGDNTVIRAPMVANTNVAWVIENGTFYASGNIGGTGGLTKYNGGTLRLQGTNTYTGATVARAGTLMLDFSGANAPLTDIVNPDSPLRMEGGYLHLMRKATASRSQAFDGVTAAIGASTARVESFWDANARMTFDAFNRMPGATLNLRQPSGNTTIKASNGFTTSQANDSTGILGAYLTVSPENSDIPADWAANNGVNIVAYTGYTTPVGSPAVIANGPTSNVQLNNTSTGDITLESSAVAVNTLKFADTSARKLDLAGGTLRLGGSLGSVLVPSGQGVLSITNGTITSGGASGELAFINASDIVVSAALTDTGSDPVALTKSGSGKLTFLAAPSHTGGTFVNAGSLYLPKVANPLITTANLTVNGGAKPRLEKRRPRQAVRHFVAERRVRQMPHVTVSNM